MTGGVVQVLCYVRIVGVHYTHRETETDSQVVAQTTQGKEETLAAALLSFYVSTGGLTLRVRLLARSRKVSGLADHTRTYVRQLSDDAAGREAFFFHQFRWT